MPDRIEPTPNARSNGASTVVIDSPFRHHPDLAALPKAELHIHIEGSIRPDTLRELADREGAQLPSALTPTGWRFEGPDHFIEQYAAACSLLRRPEDIQRVGVEFCHDLSAAGVRYAEAIFSPSQHATTIGDPFAATEAVLDGLRQGEIQTGTTVRIAPDVIRDFGMGAAETTLAVALRFRDEGVIGLNCAGSEQVSTKPFAPLFRRAKDAGLASLPHAGEWAGPRSVWETLEDLLPDRIGHGVRASDDPALMEHLAKLRIPLEVCPLSNIATRAYPNLDAHPFAGLRSAGVTLTLNSDDPAMFGGVWIDGVFARSRDAFGLDRGSIAELARTAVSVSLAPEQIKTEILAGIGVWQDRAPEGELEA
jgi:adenosine deaminase